MSVTDQDLKQCIKAATLELCCGDEPFRDRLCHAVKLLDSSLGLREEWPAALYSRARDISDEVKSSESTDPVIDELDLVSAQRLAERILHLYADSHSTPQRHRIETRE